MILRTFLVTVALFLGMSLTVQAGDYYEGCMESLSGKFPHEQLDNGCFCAEQKLMADVDRLMTDEQVSAVILSCFEVSDGNNQISDDVDQERVQATIDDYKQTPVFQIFYDRCLETFRGEVNEALSLYCECNAKVFIEEAARLNAHNMDSNAGQRAVQGSFEARLSQECVKPN